MATITYKSPDYSNLSLELYLDLALHEEHGETYYTKTNYVFGGYKLIFSGDGFTYDEHGRPTSGTVTGLTVTTPDGAEVVNATGFSLSLLSVYNGTARQVLDLLFAGSDTTTGTSSSDRLGAYGGGIDTLDGQGGDDTLEAITAGSVLIGGAGTDKAVLYRTSETRSFKLDLSLAQQTLVDDTSLSGIERVDFRSGSGADTLIGGAYDDRLHGGDGNDVLDGGKGDDTIEAGAGNDTVYSRIGSGASSMDGGADIDFIVIDRTNLTDAMTVNLAVDPAIRVFHVLADGSSFGRFERMEFRAGSGADTIAGAALDDALFGGGGGDTLTGNGGHDRLDGGAGADKLTGGAGNDTYVVDASDTVIEAARGGRDMVLASGNYRLAAGVEVEVLKATSPTSTAGLHLTGNEFGNEIGGTRGANVLQGLGGNDKLAGGLGNDVLTGGAARDAFVFDTRLNRSSNVDRITDFNVRDDTIQLDNAVFATLGRAGQLLSSAFHTGRAAHDASDRIIYDRASGALYYDVDGTGRAAQVKFAQLSSDLALTKADFLVI